MKSYLFKAFSLVTLLLSTHLSAQVTTQWGPDNYIRIEEGSGGFFADLDPGDRFGRDHDVIGDVNGDGVKDLVIGARSDDDGQTDAGAVYILFMNNDGTVQSNQKISMLEGGFDENLLQSNWFGYGVAGIGDYDNDNIPDIAVTATGVMNQALYIIHLNSDGTVKSFVKNENISSQGLTAIGDLNNDGRIDLVACDSGSDIGGNNRGAIKILFFDSASQIILNSTVTIGSDTGGFGAGLENNDRFGGREVTMLGDLDNDGNQEMAVGAFMSDQGRGAIWILSLDANNFQVISKLKITEGMNGFNDVLETDANPNGTSGAQFGHAMCAAGDLNGDGIVDLITGANQQGLGDAYILYMNADKTVKTYAKIDELEGGFDLQFDSGDQQRFSRSISFVGDLRGDGTIAINVGGGVGVGGSGTLYLLFFQPCDFNEYAGLNFWTGGNTLFSNWDHNAQMLTSDSLTFEQCTFKAFETDAPYMTYNPADGRCICKDSTATLSASTEMSTAYSNACNDFITTSSHGIHFDSQANVFPNPTNAELILEIKDMASYENTNFTLFSLLGKKLLSSNISSQQTSINLINFPKGIYILVASVNGESKTFKILKE